MKSTASRWKWWTPPGNPIGIKSYLTQKENAALAGRVYQPQIGFDLIGNAAGGANKYPYSPFYGGFSPHASIAWNPNFNGGLVRENIRAEQYRDPRRIWPHLRPAERRRPDAGAAARPRLAPGRGVRRSHHLRVRAPDLAARSFSRRSASAWTAWLRRCLR